MFIASAKIPEREGIIFGLQVHGIRSCRLMWLRLDQTMRNLTSGDLGILLVVIQLRVTGLKKTKVVYLLDLFEGRGEKGQWDLVCLERL